MRELSLKLVRANALFMVLALAACADGGEADAGTDTGGRDTGGDVSADVRPDVPGTMGSCTLDTDCVDDDIFCNGRPRCFEGNCVAGAAPSCSDGIACTQDSCNPATDECTNLPLSDACPERQACLPGSGCVELDSCEFDDDCLDSSMCNGAETCAPGGMCQGALEPANCDDGDSCTIDECNTDADLCQNTPADNLTNLFACGPTGANDCVVCPPAVEGGNQTAVCNAGLCELNCNEPFVDMDGDPDNGCECAATGDDFPDLDFEDADCDGIDGNKGVAFFVAPAPLGDDSNPGTIDSPFATINKGVRAANESGRTRKEVYVASGTYSGVLTIRNGVSIYGNYNPSEGWSRSASAMTISEGNTTGATGNGITEDLTIQYLTIVAEGATASGASSYGVTLFNSPGHIRFEQCEIAAGPGADGVDGSDGADGARGVDGRRGADGCGNCSSGACGSAPCGTGGVSTCGGGTGGRGGNGGNRSGNGIRGQAGASGSPGGGMGGGPGNGGAGSCNAVCGGTVNNGLVGTVGSNGADGSNAMAPLVALGSWTLSAYAPATGTVGSAGRPGGGGGAGGGGGGSCRRRGLTCNNEDRGGQGGGGGSGGCGGAAGMPGEGGGGSFGIVADNSQVTVSLSTIRTSQGGAGGDGGDGGGRGAPGAGQPGGSSSGDSKAGGAGASGGRGGAGGAATGGPGGPSIGVLSIGTLPVTVAVGSIIMNGPGGDGGAGGTSPLGNAPNGLEGASEQEEDL